MNVSANAGVCTSAFRATLNDMQLSTAGLHHLTAIATRAQANIEFYVRVLGLRLVKRTVNFDDPQTYHLYYGDALGRPGSVMSFFSWPGSGPASRGAGEATGITFKVPPGSLQLWADRLESHDVTTATVTRFGAEVLVFSDQDGVPLELTEHPIRGTLPFNWPGAPVPAQMAIQGLHAATLNTADLDATAQLLQALGMTKVGEEPEPVTASSVATNPVRTGAYGEPPSADPDDTASQPAAASTAPQRRVRLLAGSDAGGSVDATHIDLVQAQSSLPGRLGAGSIHHLALRVPSESELQQAIELLRAQGMSPTTVKNRLYFKSVYFKEPGGAILEVATDSPGFTVDEGADELGLAFRLPDWLESERDFLRARLPVTASPEYTDRFGPAR